MSKKTHPWKICPLGTYFVKGHNKTVNGKVFYWNSHCRQGPDKKEILNYDEILEIAKRFKNEKLKMPKSYDFKVPGNLGNKYDLLIAGWVKYWSDTLGDKTNINVDFIKTLIKTESTFASGAKAQTHNIPGQAIGLMQITDYTLKLIQENEKELRNHAFNLKREDLLDPNINICVGVRWAFRKRELAKYYLKKEPSQLELAEEYKGIRNDKSSNADIQRKNFLDAAREYKNAKIIM